LLNARPISYLAFSNQPSEGVSYYQTISFCVYNSQPGVRVTSSLYSRCLAFSLGHSSDKAQNWSWSRVKANRFQGSKLTAVKGQSQTTVKGQSWMRSRVKGQSWPRSRVKVWPQSRVKADRGQGSKLVLVQLSLWGCEPKPWRHRRLWYAHKPIEIQYIGWTLVERSDYVYFYLYRVVCCSLHVQLSFNQYFNQYFTDIAYRVSLRSNFCYIVIRQPKRFGFILGSDLIFCCCLV